MINIHLREKKIYQKNKQRSVLHRKKYIKYYLVYKKSYIFVSADTADLKDKWVTVNTPSEVDSRG